MGDLQGLRPGGRIELAEFKDEAKILNELEGRCKACDVENGVWHIVMDDLREVRVLPLRFKPGGPESPTLRARAPDEPYKGKVIYHSAGAPSGGSAGQTFHPTVWVHKAWENESYKKT